MVLFSSLGFLRSSSFFGCFVVLFSSLSFLCSRFLSYFVVFFSSLGFLCSFFLGSFVVLFSGLSFLRSVFFHSFFVVLFSSLSFLSGFVFLVRDFMRGFSSRRSVSRGSGRSRSCCSWRSGGVSSESNRRETHSSGDDQCKQFFHCKFLEHFFHV